MGRRTGKKRGAPFGNRNSVTHGRFTAAALASRRRTSARLQEAMALDSVLTAMMRLYRAERAGVDIAQFAFIAEQWPRGGPPSGI